MASTTKATSAFLKVTARMAMSGTAIPALVQLEWSLIPSPTTALIAILLTAHWPMGSADARLPTTPQTSDAVHV